MAATRQREDLQVYVPKSELKNEVALVRSVSRWSGSDLIRDHVAKAPEPGRDRRAEPSAAPDPVPRIEELRRETRSLFRRLNSYHDRLPTSEEMTSIEDRLQALRESPHLMKPADGIENWSGQGEYRLLLRRLTERADLYRYQRVASEALETSWNGTESEQAEAMERFRTSWRRCFQLIFQDAKVRESRPVASLSPWAALPVTEVPNTS